MALTPVEIRHMRPARTPFGGYRRDPTDQLLDDIVASFEDVWRERADLADKVEQLEADLVRFRELETLLRTTLVSAEQASEQVRDQARREAELILSEAQAEVREMQRRAVMENERLQNTARRMRAQLTEALAVIDEESAAKSETAQPAAEEDDGWLVVPDADAA
jgi:cell division initiation protein